jgi:phenylalanyl-tRNA synthetase beta subunit
MTKGRTKRRCIERMGSSGTGFHPHRLDFQRIKGRVSDLARISGLGWELWQLQPTLFHPDVILR